MEKEEEKETPSKRLTEAQWLVASSLWERGEVTLRELAEKFDVSEAALSQGFKRRDIKRGSKAHLAHKEIEAKTREEKSKLIEEIFEFKKRFLKHGDYLMGLAMREIKNADEKNELDKLQVRQKIENVFAATKVYKTIRNETFHLYGLYDENNGLQDNQLEFNIGVYSEKELETLREAQEMYAKQFDSDNDESGDGDEDEGEA